MTADERADLLAQIEGLAAERDHHRVANEKLRAEIGRLRGLVEASFREGWCTAGAVKEVFASEAWPRSDAKAALDAGEEEGK